MAHVNIFVHNGSENFDFYYKRKDPLFLQYSFIMIINLVLKFDSTKSLSKPESYMYILTYTLLLKAKLRLLCTNYFVFAKIFVY